MNSDKFFQLNSIKIEDRTIVPIVHLDVTVFKNIFFNIDFEVSAFKIIENKKIYFININLNQNDFEYIIKCF